VTADATIIHSPGIPRTIKIRDSTITTARIKSGIR
jgi:hypothetical protein